MGSLGWVADASFPLPDFHPTAPSGVSPLQSVPLRAYTTSYLADPSKPVGTAVSDLYALGCSVQNVVGVS
jgi:hypothetical protein